MGLSAGQAERLREYLGAEAELELWRAEDIPGIHDMEQKAPCVLWVSSAAHRSMLAKNPAQIRHLELIPKVLLLDDSYSLQDFEEASDSGAADIVRPPLTKKRVRGILRRALAAQEVHHDIMCMTREILLERELLERKNELLSFLVDFLTHTRECSEPAALITTALTSLKELFPVHTGHAAVFAPDSNDVAPLHLFIGADYGSEHYAQARRSLLEHARQAAGCKVEAIHENILRVERQWVPDSRLISLPLSVGGNAIGLLLVETSLHRNIGRDQAKTLESALGHLALSLKNTCAVEELRHHADYDALTGLHCRRHFDKRLREEMDRVERYGMPLSMVLLDIDHFKRVNDTRGHQVGDMVLRQTAEILRRTLRLSDYSARFGGEEFCLLLPDTDAVGAMVQAERLRKAFAEHIFTTGGEPLRLTASFGVAETCAENRDTPQALLHAADSALYSAKNSGRNRSRFYMMPLVQAAS